MKKDKKEDKKEDKKVHKHHKDKTTEKGKPTTTEGESEFKYDTTFNEGGWAREKQ